MLRAKVITAVVVSLLSGCATQVPELVDEDGKALPAPVREASILAPAEVEDVKLAVEAELAEGTAEIEGQIDEAAVESPESLDIVDSAEPLATAEPSASNILQDEVAAIQPLVTPESVAVDFDPGESVVSDLLNPDGPFGQDGLIAGEAKGESDVAAYLLDEAQNSFERENYEKARGQAERALTLEPTAARAYLILARIEIIEGQPEKAAEMARRGLSSVSDTDDIFEQLNQILAEVADMQPASADAIYTPTPGLVETP